MSMNDAVDGEDHGTLHAVFQLADIARPVIGGQHVDGGCRDTPHLLAVLTAVLLEEMISQKHHVRLPLPQGGDEDGKDIQSIEEILSKGAICNRLLQVDVGRGDDPNIDHPWFLAAESFDLSCLQYAQKFDLHRRGEFADFVEEDRAPVGALESS